MGRDQAQHRQRLESIVVQGNDRRATHGLYLGFVLALSVLGLGFTLVFQGRDVAGFATLGATAATLAGVFVYGRYQQRKERESKARMSQPRSSVQPELPFPSDNR
jgi:hypothetical protein